MNDDTFGAGADSGAAQGSVGRDFDFFGNTAQVSNAIGEEQVRYTLQQPQSHLDYSASRTKQPKRSGYEKYEDPGYIPDIQAKSGAWSSKTQPGFAQPSGESRFSTGAPTRKMLSLEEVEAQMRAQSQPQPHPPPFPQPDPYAYQQHPPSAPPPQMPHHGPQYPPMQPPQHMPPQQIPPPQQMPPQQIAPQQIAPQQMSRVAPAQQRLPPQAVQARGSQQPLQILQNPNRPRHSPQPSMDRAPVGPGGQPVITNPQQLMHLSEEQRKVYLEEDAKRAKRNHKIFLLSKGNGLMTPQDKNFITRIQLQQLVSATSNANDGSPEAALAEDFYYQVYSQIRGAPRQHPTQPLGHFAQTYLFQTGNRTGNNRRHQVNGDNHMQRMQQQVARAVEAAKLKPKNKQLIIEGSLGKISFSNAKTPKPLLNIKRSENAEARPAGVGQVSKSDRKSSLRNIEAVYTDLMNLEDFERKMPPPPQEGDADAVQASIEWRETFKSLIAKLWQDLKVLDPIVPGSLETHPFVAMLSFPKCKKIIPRVFRLIDQEQRVTILTMIVVHLDQLDVVRNGKTAPGESQPPAAVREDIELFNQQVLPCLLGYISDAPINIVIGLLGLILDHTNVGDVVQTKIGLAMLTILLSRAELVKETGTVSEQDTQQWSTLYNRFFDTLETLLGYIFPGPVNSGDDVYVWQFLAAVGIGANPEQQQRLVIGVKDRVMETVMQSKALPAEMSNARLANVNLFMRAIGLDVEMLG